MVRTIMQCVSVDSIDRLILVLCQIIFWGFLLFYYLTKSCYWHSCWMIKLLHSDVVISLPTFIIAECVLIYLDPDSTRGIIGWAAKTFPTAVFFLYEQVLHFWKLRIIHFSVFVDCGCFLGASGFFWMPSVILYYYVATWSRKWKIWFFDSFSSLSYFLFPT